MVQPAKPAPPMAPVSVLPAAPWLLAGLLLAISGTLGCDPLVGGECQDGFFADGTECLPILDELSTANGGHPGSGGDGGFTPGSSGGGSGGFGASSGSGGAAGAEQCALPLTQCPAGCVDLDSDFSNCGACGVHCPTELCIDGACIGDPVGHTVIIGMSYLESSASTRRLLGNAVFRSLHSPLRIVDYRDYAVAGASQVVVGAVASEAALRGRSYALSTVGLGGLEEALVDGASDVLLVHDQALAPEGVLAGLGQALAGPIEDFVTGGGTVVVLATDTGSGEMCDFLGASGMLECTGFASMVGQWVINVLPTDTMGNGVPSPLLAKEATAAILTKEGPSPGIAHVFTNETASPVVIHKVTGP
ncbi:MAG: hypothetical protein DRI90_04735 [Deltaproteobacteria bacterium]|nr:MAG: hypothetical protein DRI90_04735 [Deltaproteobacteria bacterium]